MTVQTMVGTVMFICAALVITWLLGENFTVLARRAGLKAQLDTLRNMKSTLLNAQQRYDNLADACAILVLLEIVAGVAVVVAYIICGR